MHLKNFMLVTRFDGRDKGKKAYGKGDLVDFSIPEDSKPSPVPSEEDGE